MIDVYSWPTPNGHKVHIMLEECGLEYTVHPVNIGAGEQFEPSFLEISPNNRIPAIVDQDGPGGQPYSLFESGAILMYLAEKTGRFLPAATAPKYRVIEWVMFQMGNVGPMFGQANHFRSYAPEKVPYAINRYTNEVRRLYGVLNRRLGESRFLGGDVYTIADIMTFPWMRYPDRRGVDEAEFPNVQRWRAEIEARPAVQRGVEVLADAGSTTMDDKAKEILFGATQYQRR
jgi:GST-like protein